LTATATRKVAPPLAASTRLEGIVLGSSALFANSHAQSTTSKEVIRADVAEMARVFNPCVSSARGRPTRPEISAMPGEAIGYVL
jgi:hypothetical protein